MRSKEINACRHRMMSAVGREYRCVLHTRKTSFGLPFSCNARIYERADSERDPSGWSELLIRIVESYLHYVSIVDSSLLAIQYFAPISWRIFLASQEDVGEGEPYVLNRVDTPS